MMRPLALLIVLLSACTAFAQDTSALIAEQLDKQIDLQINATLPDAMRQISDKTGVKIEAEQAVWDLLPWGQLTNINAQIRNQTLRQALDALTRTLGLSYSVQPEAIQLQPMPALRRLGRRATVQELQTLNLLASTSLNATERSLRANRLIERIDFRLAELKAEVAVDYRNSAAGDADIDIFIPRNATLMEALESVAENTASTWYPWGKSIVVSAKHDQVRRQLEKKISIRYDGVDLAQVLTELSQKAGVDFAIEPGAIQAVAPEFRNVKLIFEDAEIRQALETIAGFTGLGYVIKDDGVYLWNSTGLPAAPTTTTTRDPLIAIITIDDKGTQVAVLESMISPEARDALRKTAVTQIEQQLAAQAAAEAPAVAVEPATESALEPAAAVEPAPETPAAATPAATPTDPASAENPQ